VVSNSSQSLLRNDNLEIDDRADLPRSVPIEESVNVYNLVGRNVLNKLMNKLSLFHVQDIRSKLCYYLANQLHLLPVVTFIHDYLEVFRNLNLETIVPMKFTFDLYKMQEDIHIGIIK